MPSTTRALWSAQAHIPSIAGRQIIVDRGEGCYVFSTDGRRLFDGTAGLWHANVGHGRAELADAARRQMERLETYHTFGRYLNDQAVALAERLAGLSPIPDAKVIFNSGGSDAIDVACKLARRHWQVRGRHEKTFVLSRTNSYHGLHAYGTSIAGLEFNREGYGTDSLVPETGLVSHDDIAAVEREVDRIGAHRIAAMVAEPVMGTGGVLPPAPGYLEGLQRLCREHDILLIADEVITGFGRTGRMFATERYGIEPHIMTMAKGITSGYAPLGGILVAREIWEPFFEGGAGAPIFRHGITYSGHATAAAVAMANLDVIEREDLVARVRELEGVLGDELGALAGHDLVADVRVAGFLGGVSLIESVAAETVTDAMLGHGIISRPLRGNTVQFSPPFVSTDDEVRTMTAALRDVLDELGLDGATG